MTRLRARLRLAVARHRAAQDYRREWDRNVAAIRARANARVPVIESAPIRTHPTTPEGKAALRELLTGLTERGT